MSDELNWNDIDTEESVSKEEIESAESSNRRPVGKYICTVESVKPKQRNPDNKPSYFVAGLKMVVDSVVEIGGVAADDEVSEKHEGKFIFDDISLPRVTDDEPEALKNRRILIAKRAGIISPSSTKIPGNCWNELIIGKQFLIDYIDSKPDKSGRIYRQVAFDGYHAPEEVTKVTADDLADI